MSLTAIKINAATFSYYILRVSLDSKLEQIKAKLASLHKLDSVAKYIAIECVMSLDNQAYSKLIPAIEEIATKFALQVKFIVANEVFNEGMLVAAKPVINLPATIKTEVVLNQPLLWQMPVRSGMRVENDGEIIILNLVSDNAEIVAGGNIHIYGECRGRVLAGSNGDKQARIFIQKFNAELISIAGIYRVLEEKLPANLHKKAVQIFLDDKERLNIVPLNS